MKTAQPAQRPFGQEPTNVFGDPWNEPASTAAKVRTTVAFVVFLALVVLFAATASAWVSSFSPAPALSRPAADAPKANERGRAAQSPVLVLAPAGMSAAQAEEFTQRLRVTPDGYFSRVTYGAYDVVVNGSAHRTAPRSGPADATIRISETETGLAAMFARDDADYLVEFSCRGPGSEAGVRCITDAEARTFVSGFAAFGEGIG